ncbi:MAG: BCD family MFS transporter [Pseudomonadota bacterium]
MTSTLNRVMTVELALPAMLPGALVALHYLVQLSRPGFGHASDQHGRRTPWILGGIALLGLGALIATASTGVLTTQTPIGVVIATVGFTFIGAGVGAGGTSLLALLAAEVPDERRAAAGAIVWIMMIVGFVLTTIIAGQFLDPFSVPRLLTVTAVVVGAALLLALIALIGLEPYRTGVNAETRNVRPKKDATPNAFRDAVRGVWDDRRARHFTVFVFVSMLAYSTQDLILEPFAALVFDYSIGETTRLAGIQNQGVLLGMLAIAIAGTRFAGSPLGSLRFWTVAGCSGSALALAVLVWASLAGPPWPLPETVFALGFSNGVFAVAAIASMMALAGAGPHGQEGVRMGVWGAAQAIAFAAGGFLGTALYDSFTALGFERGYVYALIFITEAAIFLAAAGLATRIESLSPHHGVREELKGNATWRLTS